MSAPSTGPTRLSAEQKFYNTIGLTWETEQDPCEQKPELYRVYRIEGLEPDGQIIRDAGSLIGVTADPILVDLIPYDIKGFYSYAITAVYQDIESEPTTGKFVYL